ncbi:MAG: aldose 1-epimerase family protein [Clostridia bacterium]|nr:aldose 1-epimerase family protein [Clostridia bacterium]NCC42608.1 aldose 1-epimerase family protein [Clostridia bacterium]
MKKQTMNNYILENERIRAVIKSKSAELSSLVRKDTDQEYLWNGDPRFWERTSPILFPAVGAFRDDQYSYQDKKYHMEKHGFAKNMEFHVDSIASDEIWLSIEDTEETYSIYPFHFRLEAGYKLEDTKLNVIWRVINKDEDVMYFSIGGHPALRCPMNDNGKKTDCYLGIESDEDVLDYIMVDQSTMRIGNKVHTFQMEDGLYRITPGMFDLDALIFENYQVGTAYLADESKNIYIKMHTKAPVMAFWSPEDDAPFVCFEPWYGRGDGVDFNGSLKERTWEQSVAGKDTFEASYQLEIITQMQHKKMRKNHE